jgi:hypothetical protein
LTGFLPDFCHVGGTMPKLIDVILETISCERNDSGRPVVISGATFGATFQNDPNNPGDQKDKRDIFLFPDGPIIVAPGEPKDIAMKDSVTFTLSAPSQEPADRNPKFLKITGDLKNGLGSNFFSIKFDEPLPDKQQTGEGTPTPEPRKFPLKFGTPDVDVTLTFGLITNSIF